MNVFSSDLFLEAVAKAYRPNARFVPADVMAQGRRFRVALADGEPLLRIPFLDFLEELPATVPAAPTTIRVKWLPAVQVGMVSRDVWLAQPPSGARPSPRIAWAGFPTWESYTDAIRERPGVGFGKSADQRIGKLQKVVGSEVTFRFEAGSPELLRTCIGWKSRQYLVSGYIDLFQNPKTVRLFEELLASGLLTMAVLLAGERPLAIHAGLLHEGRYYYWLPAYDPELHAHSPGTILMQKLLQASYQAGHREFDFLLGNESYKWKFATDTRVVEPLGKRLWQDQTWGPLRSVLVEQVRRFPQAYESLRGAKRWSQNLKK